MRILKELNCQVIIIVVLTVAIVADAYLPREISGKNTLGGCPPCYTTILKTCPHLDNRQCTHVWDMCTGSKGGKCHPRKEEPSDCSDDQYNCKNKEDELCY